ncbi:MAG: RNA polymerase sigma factor [Acidobacteriaceae bacterium]
MNQLGNRTAENSPHSGPLMSELLSHRAKFLGFLLSRVDEGAAEDILQSAYIRALEKGGQIKKSESVVAWFYRILRNAIVDHFRRDAARNRAHEQNAAEVPISYEAEVEANLCKCVEGVIRTLNEDYRKALERVDLGGESVADFARSEGTTPNNASVRLHRARKAAAKKLTQVCGACAKHMCLDCTCKRRV